MTKTFADVVTTTTLAAATAAAALIFAPLTTASSQANHRRLQQQTLPVQTYFVPLPEKDLLQTLQRVNDEVDGNIVTLISVAVARNNTILWYDHWEDGYETDVTNPTQNSTLVIGDGDVSNGALPGVTQDVDDVLYAGTSIILENTVPLNDNAVSITFDARDKLQTSFPIAVTRGAYPEIPGSLFAGAVEVQDTDNWGMTFEIPVGPTTEQQISTMAFELTEVYIMAQEDNTNVTLPDGSFLVLQQGESANINAHQGDVVQSTRPIQTDILVADENAKWELRWYSLLPREDWSTEYYTPVGTANQGETVAWLYNPNDEVITVTSNIGGPYTIPPKATIRSDGVPEESGARFASNDNKDFFGIVQVDADWNPDGPSGQEFDWGHPLIPSDQLTSQALIGLGYGCTSNDCDGDKSKSVVFAMPVQDATICVDFENNGYTDDGRDISFALSALEGKRISDDVDNDMSGALIYGIQDGTCAKPGTPVDIAVAWGQDPSTILEGADHFISLDLGTVVVPFPEIEASKSVTLKDTAGDGEVNTGDVLVYTILVQNTAKIRISAGAFLVRDFLPEGTSYVAGSATYDSGSGPESIDDDAIGSAFPLDDVGLPLQARLKPNKPHRISFEVTVKSINELTSGTTEIINEGDVYSNGNPDSPDDTFRTVTPLVFHPSIAIDNRATLGPNGDCSLAVDQLQVPPNADVTYCFTILNDGDTFLNTDSIADAVLEGRGGNFTGTVPPILAPGDDFLLVLDDNIQLDFFLNNSAIVKALPTFVDGQLIPNVAAVEDEDDSSVEIVTAEPTFSPTAAPTNRPTNEPSNDPSAAPSETPSSLPSEMPSSLPSLSPSHAPSESPSRAPSASPSATPSASPSAAPSDSPSSAPSGSPSSTPSLSPSSAPSAGPSSEPSNIPSWTPSLRPSLAPSTRPSPMPSLSPSSMPSEMPSLVVSEIPSSVPSEEPTVVASDGPSSAPSVTPTAMPSEEPSSEPSFSPSSAPSAIPSSTPSSKPSLRPSSRPSPRPSTSPSESPTAMPSEYPSSIPSETPSVVVSDVPSSMPSEGPSAVASEIPSTMPSPNPTLNPTMSYSAIKIINTVLPLANGGDECPGEKSIVAEYGTSLTYCFEIINIGDVPLTNIKVSNPDLEALGVVIEGDIPGILPSGGSFIVYVEDMLTTDLMNNATVEAMPATGGRLGDMLPVVSDMDDSLVQVITHEPTLTPTNRPTCPYADVNIENSVYAGHDNGASCPGNEIATGFVGASVTYCFVVTNNGVFPLSNITVGNNDLLNRYNSDIKGVIPDVLQPQDSFTVYIEETLREDLINTATVMANPINTDGSAAPPRFSEVTDFDTSTVEAIIRVNGGTPTSAPIDTLTCEVDVDVSCNAAIFNPMLKTSTTEKCRSRPNAISFKYVGGGCDQRTHDQFGDFECEDDADAGPPPTSGSAKITVANRSGRNVYFSDTIDFGDTFEVYGPGDRFGGYTSVKIEAEGKVRQSFVIHTTCADDLALNDVFGALQIVGYKNEEQGAVSVEATHDGVEMIPCSDIQAPQSLSCYHRPTAMSFKYVGGGCTETTNEQFGRLSCIDANGAPPMTGGVNIQVTSTPGGSRSKDVIITYFSGDVTVGESFDLDIGMEVVSSRVRFVVRETAGGKMLQDVTFQASCSKPLSVFDQFGALQLMSYTNDAQGTVSGEIDVTYTYTVKRKVADTSEIGLVVERDGGDSSSLLENGDFAVDNDEIVVKEPRQVLLTRQSYVSTTSATVTGLVGTAGFRCDTTLDVPIPALPDKPDKDGVCETRPLEMSLTYLGGDCDQTTNTQSGAYTCETNDPVAVTSGKEATLTITNKSGNVTYFAGSVAVGETFALNTGGNRMTANVRVAVEIDGKIVQTIMIHSSCSKDLFAGDIFGSMQLYSFMNVRQGSVTMAPP